jgi:DNA-binding response OmpR family regulator
VLLAAQLVDLLEEAGLAAEPAPSVEAALRVVDAAPLRAAILDINLGKETGFKVARELARRGIPFIFLIGYADTQLPDDLEGSTVLRKPVHAATLLAQLGSILSRSV